jgi:phosphatidylserine decarboxylase
LNALSKITDSVAGWRIPKPLRKPIFLAYSWFYGCHLDEATKPVEEYETLQDFFTRRLRDGVRTISDFGMVRSKQFETLYFHF